MHNNLSKAQRSWSPPCGWLQVKLINFSWMSADGTWIRPFQIGFFFHSGVYSSVRFVCNLFLFFIVITMYLRYCVTIFLTVKGSGDALFFIFGFLFIGRTQKGLCWSIRLVRFLNTAAVCCQVKHPQFPHQRLNTGSHVTLTSKTVTVVCSPERFWGVFFALKWTGMTPSPPGETW